MWCGFCWARRQRHADEHGGSALTCRRVFLIEPRVQRRLLSLLPSAGSISSVVSANVERPTRAVNAC